LNEEQRAVFDVVVDDAMNWDERRLGYSYFVHSASGCGKTYLCKLIASKLHAEGNIVLCVASSRIPSLLLLGGHTACSQFKIPIPIHKDSSCNIKK
ncbi:hypothetical protein BDR06DRAFT_826672, partial [Suillus hirtellus]